MTKTCARCGTSFIPKGSRSRYCTRLCAQDARWGHAPPGDDRWHQDAACRGSQVDFVPSAQADAEPAMALCAGCPVVTECLSRGLANREYGVWGGQWLTPNKKRKGGEPNAGGTRPRQ